jgi:hypothetical protein
MLPLLAMQGVSRDCARPSRSIASCMTSPPPRIGWVRSLFWIEGLSVLGLLLLAPGILGSKTSGRGMGAIGLVVFVGAWALGSLLVGAIATVVALATAPRAKLTRVMAYVHAPPALALLALGGWKLWEWQADRLQWERAERFRALVEAQRYRDAEVYLRAHPGWEFDCGDVGVDQVFAPTRRHAAAAVALLRILQAHGLSRRQLQQIGMNGPESAELLVREKFLTRADLEQMLHWGGYLDTWHVDVLLGLGVDINVPDQDGRTALMLSHGEMLRYMLAHGADPRRRDRWGQTAVSYAETVDDYRLLQSVGLDLNERDKNGDAPLTRAERHADRELQDFLSWALAPPLEQDAGP